MPQGLQARGQRVYISRQAKPEYPMLQLICNTDQADIACTGRSITQANTSAASYRYHGEFQLREFCVLISVIELFMDKVWSSLKAYIGRLIYL